MSKNILSIVFRRVEVIFGTKCLSVDHGRLYRGIKEVFHFGFCQAVEKRCWDNVQIPCDVRERSFAERFLGNIPHNLLNLGHPRVVITEDNHWGLLAGGLLNFAVSGGS